MTDTVASRELPPTSIDVAAQDEQHRKWTPKKIIIWSAIALLGGVAWVMIAFVRGETINAVWFVFASVCSYLIAFRFYSKLVERKITRPDDTRATPAEYKENGLDYLPTDRRVLFGHHFAAIAGAGPLVGPVLAVQMGYLPGTIWIIVGVILAGAVQDYLVLFFSMRRGGRSLGQMARDQLGRIGGTAAILATLLIMLIIVAILALVVVNALGESPWGVFSVGMTLPIALFMGCYLRFLRPGKVGEVSIIGFVLLIAAIAAGRLVAESPYWSEVFSLERLTLAWIIVAYGFFAAILPVWLLLAPRDYLSTFMKVGTIVMLAVAIVIVRPVITVPPLSEFAAPRRRTRLGGTAVPVPVRHHRLRGAVRVPRPDRLRHHTEADREGATDSTDRLRRHADGVVRGDHGAGRRAVHRPRHLLRDELLRRGHRRHPRDRGRVRQRSRADRGQPHARHAHLDRPSGR